MVKCRPQIWIKLSRREQVFNAFPFGIREVGRVDWLHAVQSSHPRLLGQVLSRTGSKRALRARLAAFRATQDADAKWVQLYPLYKGFNIYNSIYLFQPIFALVSSAILMPIVLIIIPSLKAATALTRRPVDGISQV